MLHNVKVVLMTGDVIVGPGFLKIEKTDIVSKLLIVIYIYKC